MENSTEGKFKNLNPMGDLGKMLFDQATETNRMAASYLKLGRQQLARDVMLWITKTGIHTFGAVPIGELVELCRKESEGE